MTVHVRRPGVQTTLQAGARRGLRHLGVPASGPADPLSMALANRLTGNPPDAPCLEFTLGGAELEFRRATAFAITGAEAPLTLSGAPCSAHQTIHAGAGDVLRMGHPAVGVRIYLAVAGGFEGEAVFGSRSTCLPAGFGGHEGRALRAGDELSFGGGPIGEILTTPTSLRPVITHSHTLRCVAGPDFDPPLDEACAQVFHPTRRMDRTGIEVAGPWPKPKNGGGRLSAALFPGAVQLTPSGQAYILLPDAQTTGGYPHILQMIRADRHLLGQIAPGDSLQFLCRDPNTAREDLRAKTALFASWLPGFRF